VKEMAEEGELLKIVPKEANLKAEADAAEALNKRLESLITSAPVMLFMKGSPEAPRCGFSASIAQLLQQQGVTFGSFDILGDSSVREGLKKYSNWPTFPQLYVKGKLLGGLDIVKELVSEGEFIAAIPDECKVKQ